MPKKPAKTEDYEKLGRIIESVFASDFVSRKKLYWLNFSRGLFFGLGATLGGTLVITLIAWILSFFTELPFVGSIVESLDNTTNQ